ncbi:MAG: Hsp70 family protein [Aureliella sp.]
MSQPLEQPDAFESRPSRYIVGIDLGTTNSAAAFVDTQAQGNAAHRVQSFSIEQWVDYASREQRDVLPSFHYELTGEEASAISALAGERLEYVVGTLAREAGSRQPGRQIASAKSWLCHDGVDRHAPLLPWHGDPGVTRLSPVEASSRTLLHIRRAWDRAHPDSPLAEQDVVLTLPASFDEVARQLTIEAARAAGLPRVLLIEEPQAAFYWWLYRHHANWEQVVSVGQTILVCDIGGGTTDFTLIRVREASPNARSATAESGDAETLQAQDRQRLSLHRVAVGEHLILGGDNIDLALARLVEEKLPAGQRLSPRSWDMLRGAARSAKEQLLGIVPPPQFSLAVTTGGSRLLAGQVRVELDVADTAHQLLDGFFPSVGIDARPTQHASGFQEFGLPYTSDAAITRHLAAFLWDHRRAGRTDSEQALDDLAAARPDWVLFNGGVLASTKIRQRLLQVIGGWFAGRAPETLATWQPGVLENDRLDLAVASGAAYFGCVRRGHGVRIEAKLARSYYLVVSQEPPLAMCIVGGDASPGDKNRISDTPLELAVGQPVQFPIVVSSTRLADKPGQLVEITPEQFTHLLPIRTVLQLPRRSRSERLQVILETELTELGTLQLWCATPDGAQRWQLEFDVRSTTETDRDAVLATGAELGVVEQSLRDVARGALESAFGPSDSDRGDARRPAAGAAARQKAFPDVTKQLVQALEMPKHRWPPSLLRGMWQDLMDLSEGRRRSPEAEARWLNLLGYCLRPGYGMAADDWRVSQTWRTVYGKLAFAAASSRSEALILWRRIAGGFTAGQQMAVYQQVAGPLRSVLDPVRRAKGGGVLQPAELIEMLRLVGSLELLPKGEKEQLGNWLLEVADAKRWAPARNAILWTIGRLGNRVPTYGPLNTVVETDSAEAWLEKLTRLAGRGPAWQLAVLLCARRTGDRYRDIDEGLRRTVSALLADAPPHYRTLVETGGQLAQDESSEIVGESLPLGLRTRQ